MLPVKAIPLIETVIYVYLTNEGNRFVSFRFWIWFTVVVGTFSKRSYRGNLSVPMRTLNHAKEQRDAT